MAEPRRQLPPQIKRIELARRSGGRPVVRYQLTVDTGIGPDGKRKQFRKRYATEADAREKLAEILGDRSKGTYVHPDSLTVEKACEDWLTSRDGRVAETTLSGYAWILRPVRSELGHLPVQKFERRDVDELVRQLRKGGTKSVTVRTMSDGRTKETVRARKPWKARSCNYMLLTLGMVLDQLVEDGKLVRNVVDHVDRVPGDAAKFETYTPDQVDKVLTAIADDRNRHAWYLALSALRRGEIGGLDWTEDVDFDAPSIHVGRRTRVSAGGRVVEKGAKTEAGARRLPLWDELLGELKAAKARQAAEKLRLGSAYKDLGYVVCNEVGEPYHPDTLSDMWAAVTKKAGVPHIRLQDARHTSATLMLMRGVDPATVSGWLGHANVAFTMKTYVHPQAEALAKGADVLGRIMQGRRAGS
jgi:integrase